MNEGVYYKDLSPVAQIRADEFIDRKFYEHLSDEAITMLDHVLRKNGFEPWAIMFDAENLDDIHVHATGVFHTVPHQVAYPAANLRRPKYVVIANDRAVVAAIIIAPAAKFASITVNQYLQAHYDSLRKDAAMRIRDIIVLTDPDRRNPATYTARRAQFIEDTAYEFSDDGVCIDEE